MHHRTAARAFSLVELSIVLVILGLLTGGVLTGQSMIRSANLLSVTTDYQTYLSAVKQFQTKYGSLPGDMPDATNYWGVAGGTGSDTTCRATNSSSLSNPKNTCNGNGNGDVFDPGDGTYNETYRVWQHLANAGMIKGNYSGAATGAYTWTFAIGVNAPRTSLDDATFIFLWTAPVTSGGTSTSIYDGSYGNMFFFGKNSGYSPVFPIMKAEEMWNIDKKIDDEKPAYGQVRSYAMGWRPNCVSSNNPATATYLLTDQTIGCNILFVPGL